MPRCACLCIRCSTALICAQILLFLAACFSTAALITCQFVVIDSEEIRSQLEILENGTIAEVWNSNRTVTEVKGRGLGFFIYENQYGSCEGGYLFEDVEPLSNSTSNDTVIDVGDKQIDMDMLSSSKFESYQQLLGSDWLSKRNAGISAAVLAWFFWLWLLLIACIAHTRTLRWVIGFLIGVMLTCLQGSTLTVLQSDICNEYGCKVGQSAMFAITSTVLFFVTGILMFFTKDHSQKQTIIQQDNDKAMMILPVAPIEEEMIYDAEGTPIVNQDSAPIVSQDEVPVIEAQIQETSVCSESLSRKQAILMRQSAGS